MSSQKGNTSRKRPQKHQNTTSFKNNLYDTSNKTKFINSIQVVNVCSRCKNIIEWKIKYKKYKPLKAPKKCTKCDLKAITHAYHILCMKCAREGEVCPKCGKKEEIVPEAVDSGDLKQDNDIVQALKCLSERKRRAMLRKIEKFKDSDEEKMSKEDILEKIKTLSMNDGRSDDYFDDFGEDDSDFPEESDEEEDEA
ncbi:uncharacterized protein C9orf85 homolog [Ischnura elegans]|uniref:uncharacterized protein C9orf85 homolog n=1 Tax=Ischnura elegans TaxID=197161 RepID=UPI001ED8A281|nr:uncharacterized protein C9orf85 homolog [Ischnura elegans]